MYFRKSHGVSVTEIARFVTVRRPSYVDDVAVEIDVSRIMQRRYIE
jgi:hypothetical protein